jgi:hypothetical protein
MAPTFQALLPKGFHLNPPKHVHPNPFDFDSCSIRLICSFRIMLCCVICLLIPVVGLHVCPLPCTNPFQHLIGILYPRDVMWHPPRFVLRKFSPQLMEIIKMCSNTLNTSRTCSYEQLQTYG